MTHHCAVCGVPVGIHEHFMTFRLPSPVIEAGICIGDDDLLLFGGDPMLTDFLVSKSLGFFVRALIPVPVTGKFEVSFGVWLEVEEPMFREAVRTWNTPLYPELVLDGDLANRIEPWNVLSAPVRARVHDPNVRPICVETADPELAALMQKTWPHELFFHDH